MHNSDNDSEVSDDEGSEAENTPAIAPVSSRSSRACKSLAHGRISAQLASEDGPNAKRTSSCTAKCIDEEQGDDVLSPDDCDVEAL